MTKFGFELIYYKQNIERGLQKRQSSMSFGVCNLRLPIMQILGLREEKKKKFVVQENLSLKERLS